MKKELCAILTLLLLIAGAIGNWIHLRSLTEQLSEHINYSLLYCSLEDYSAAHAETSKAFQSWQNAKSYTHVFIRHSDIDTINETFFEILSAVQNREKYEAEYLLKKLQHLTDGIVHMEKLSLGSIF